MKVLVVYDSYFGNTAIIAETIAQELNSEHIKVHSFNTDTINKYDCIIVGTPTRAFKATKEITKLVKKIERLDVKIALFDTRMNVDEVDSKLLRFLTSKFGYATDSLEKILKKNNISLAAPSNAFYVQDSEGPLVDGEIERAKEWVNSFKEV